MIVSRRTCLVAASVIIADFFGEHKAVAAQSRKCYCGRSELAPVGNGLVACTSCGLVYSEKFKRRDP